MSLLFLCDEMTVIRADNQPMVPTPADDIHSFSKGTLRSKFQAELGLASDAGTVAGLPWVGAPGSVSGFFGGAVDAVRRAGATVFGIMTGNKNDIRLLEQYYGRRPEVANQYSAEVNLFLRYIAKVGSRGLELPQSLGPELLKQIQYWKHYYANQSNRDVLIRAKGNFGESFRRRLDAGEIPCYPSTGPLANSIGSFWAVPAKSGEYVIHERYDFSYDPRVPGGKFRGSMIVPNSPSNFGRKIVAAGYGEPFEYRIVVSPRGEVRVK